MFSTDGKSKIGQNNEHVIIFGIFPFFNLSNCFHAN